MTDPIHKPDEEFKLLMKRTGDVLRQHGFKGSGQNYRRELGDQWQVINFQKNPWRLDRNDPIEFYINILVFFHRARFKRTYPSPTTLARLSTFNADQSFRISDFMSRRADWLKVDGHGGIYFERFCRRLAKLLTKQLIPTLNTMNTREGMADVMRTMPWMTCDRVRRYLGPKLAAPEWYPADKQAGKWKKDADGRWWGPGEWSITKSSKRGSRRTS